MVGNGAAAEFKLFMYKLTSADHREHQAALTWMQPAGTTHQPPDLKLLGCSLWNDSTGIWPWTQYFC